MINLKKPSVAHVEHVAHVAWTVWVIIALVLTVLTYARVNSTWTSNRALWNTAYAESPLKPRPALNHAITSAPHMGDEELLRMYEHAYYVSILRKRSNGALLSESRYAASAAALEAFRILDRRGDSSAAVIWLQRFFDLGVMVTGEREQ